MFKTTAIEKALRGRASPKSYPVCKTYDIGDAFVAGPGPPSQHGFHGPEVMILHDLVDISEFLPFGACHVRMSPSLVFFIFFP